MKRQSSVFVPKKTTGLSQSESKLDILKKPIYKQNQENETVDYEKGGPMPDDVRDMLGNSPRRANTGALPKIKVIRSLQRSQGKSLLSSGSQDKHLLSPEMTPKRKTIKKDKKRKHLISNETCSLNEKFEQEQKRNIIGDFLKNPKPELKDLILQPKSPQKARPIIFKNSD